ncbi:uncharacterized protein LOC116425971 [Nomia melanderi]|uniref:uncharacterized protein LOC116425971 n=1 Tax=Nomia melanderi TaxID=2448451 RepID=UPI003FCC92DD
MVRSKGNAKKDEPPTYKGYMELRSMSKRPPPPYSQVNSLKHVKLHNSGDQNDSNKTKEKEDVSSTIEIRSGCTKYPKCRHLSYCITGLSMVLVCALLIALFFPYPLHASCIVIWKFRDPCTHTMQKFRWQILNWSTSVNCGLHDARCLYTLNEPKANETNVIRAVHLGSNMKTMETIKITFETVNDTCVGESVSNEWFRIFDHGKNYCNLRNLVTGIGFDRSPRFLELTTNAICTQYNMAICQ